MLCIAKAENKSFIANIHHTFNRQYFLIYLLVLIQRYTLLSLEQKLTEFESTEKDDDETIKNDDETLWNLINVICRIKVNCYYTDVSIYTHHSQFYQHCCKNLHIPETFKEIDEKVELLKLTTDRKMHILMEAQREIQEEEARRHQEEIERIKLKEKEDEERRRIEKEQEEQRLAKEKEEYNKRINEAKDEAEHRQHILNWVVAILTIAQVIQASYEVISHFGELKMYLSLGIGLLGIALLVWLMWKDIIDFIIDKMSYDNPFDLMVLFLFSKSKNFYISLKHLEVSVEALCLNCLTNIINQRLNYKKKLTEKMKELLDAANKKKNNLN